MHPAANTQLYSAIVTLVVLGLIVRRTLMTQTVRVWMLVAYPAIILALGVWFLASTPQTSASVIAIFVGLLAGAALGYARGIHSRVQAGPRPGTIVVQGNVLLVVILVAAFIVRFALRSYLGSQATTSLAISDGFIAFAAGSIAVGRAMLFFAWRRLSSAI